MVGETNRFRESGQPSRKQKTLTREYNTLAGFRLRLDPDDFCPTIRAGTGHDRGRFQAVRPLHPTAQRVITPREAARLQGFPDEFRIYGSFANQMEQVTNAVPPPLARAVLCVLAEFTGVPICLHG